MNLTINYPLIQIPQAAAGFLLGVSISVKCLEKLFIITEYLLIKKFGDYDNPKKWDDKIIITINNKYSYAECVILAGIVAIVSHAAYPLLISSGCPSIIATTTLVGLIAPPILFVLYGAHACYTGKKLGNYVVVKEDEINHQNLAEKIKHDALVHLSFCKTKIYRYK